ncbi:hypothetical protein [Xanthomonas phage Suba]|uniref:Uncharacterized protein n=1 Tax=Xanthomonas phage Suba TaxID=2674975 RepID=A0A679K651_9CAUD|nr:hypothetical protein QAY88_gp46 [Xanthomonas phage Suba]CAA2409864.1 hypothetical protein [Xanthomonas phage Suba]
MSKQLPRIWLEHYPKSKRSYWRVSPLPGKWARVSDEVKARWEAAHKFKQAMNAKRNVCECCGKEL